MVREPALLRSCQAVWGKEAMKLHLFPLPSGWVVEKISSDPSIRAKARWKRTKLVILATQTVENIHLSPPPGGDHDENHRHLPYDSNRHFLVTQSHLPHHPPPHPSLHPLPHPHHPLSNPFPPTSPHESIAQPCSERSLGLFA